MKELPKAYEPREYEDDIYAREEASGFFNPDNVDGEPYSIMMPPPNVTGILHLGHALENTLLDIMIRYQRMQGKKALLLPGTDHAAVATQAKVESLLVADGITNPRQEFGRDGLLEKIREYAEESKATILNQIRKMGTSADWSRLAYTFDNARSRAVNEVFIKMYNDGLIYRGYRVVNWSVKGQSTCSDDELVYIDRKAKFYTFKYAADFPFTIATTRPETKLGDTAVAVHPEDERYKQYIGKEFEVEFCGVKLKLRVIGDEHVDPEFGTGALGVTPAHSSTDFEMYEARRNGQDAIDIVPVIGPDGRMTRDAGSDFEGLTALEAREKVVEKLRNAGLLEAEEEIDQNVGTSDRFKDVVEAIPMTQWFVAVNREFGDNGKTLKQLMKEAVEVGHGNDPAKKITITPDRFEKIYYHWIENLRDWCISRQIWWGHRIPIWYCNNKNCDAVVASAESVANCAVCGNGSMGQDPDTLDTWFSSGLWTFSTLGWPDSTPDLSTFHPTNWMQMGYEILFFWMARMILMSTYALNGIPFKDVYIHGLVRNKEGKKFSKSDGNVGDPLDIIAKYGADALRFSLISGISPGNDIRFYEEKVESSRNLVNKLWNISRFVLGVIGEPKKDLEEPAAQTLADQWVLSGLHNLIDRVTDDFNNFQFSVAAERLRDFTWNEFADWYVEIAKIEGVAGADASAVASKKHILNYVLNTLLKLWHPFMPFVTEALWTNMYGDSDLLLVEKWPAQGSVIPIHGFDIVQGAVTGIRAVRNDYKIEPKKELEVVIAGDKEGVVQENVHIVTGLAKIAAPKFEKKMKDKKGFVGFVVRGVEVYVNLAGVVDVEKEIARLKKEINEDLEPYVKRMEQKLGNESFAKGAPEEVVAAEERKFAEAKEKLQKLQDQLKSLQ